MDTNPLSLAAQLQDLQQYVAHSFEGCTGGWKSRSEVIMTRIVEIQEQVKREEKRMPDIPRAIELLSQVVAETTRRNQQERQDFESEIAYLKAEIADLKEQLSSPPLDAFTNVAEPVRYPGCYNIGGPKGGRKARIRYVSDVILILGGEKHLSKILRVSDNTVGGWRKAGFIPVRFRDQIDEMMKERGYFVDNLLYKTGKVSREDRCEDEDE
jgi:hypothetical protein